MGRKRQNRKSSDIQKDNVDKKTIVPTQINTVTIIQNFTNFTKDHPYITILSILIAILGITATILVPPILQNASEQKQISQIFSNDIIQISPFLRYKSNEYIQYQQNHILAPVECLLPYYSDQGAYYKYGNDLDKLNPELEKELTDFYENISSAEDIRKDLCSNCLDNKGNLTIETCNDDYFNMKRTQMHEEILHSTNEINNISIKLNDTINNPLAVFSP